MVGNFGLAAAEADASGLPVVEGFTTRLAPGAAPEVPEAIRAKLVAVFGGEWRADRRGEWVDAVPEHRTLPLGRAWEAARELRALPGVTEAEPLLLVRTLSPDGGQTEILHTYLLRCRHSLE